MKPGKQLWTSATIALLTRSTSHAFYMNRVSPDEFRAAPVKAKPVIVEDALASRQCDEWLSHIFTRSKKELMDVTSGGGRTARPVALGHAKEMVLTRCSHHNPVYASSAGSSCSTDQLPLYDLVDGLFPAGDVDWFPFFAMHAPIHDTLVLEGDGSSSTLSRHPYTRVSVCLGGSQLWRLLPPETTTVPSTSIDAEAWDGYAFSMGQRTATGRCLYEFRHRDIDETEWDDDGEKYNDFQIFAEKADMLRPNLPLDREWVSALALTGDMLVIPPGWWYQSYGLEPSVSIMSQRCGGDDAPGLIRHILESSELEETELLKQDFNDDNARECIEELFQVLEDKYKRS